LLLLSLDCSLPDPLTIISSSIEESALFDLFDKDLVPLSPSMFSEMISSSISS